MSESVQAVLALLLIFGMIGSVLTFLTDRVNWFAFASMISLALGSLGVLLWSIFRKDRVPDLLEQLPGPRLERDGLCFKIVPTARKGRCYLDIHFQTRYSRGCHAMVVLQPSKGFFLTRPGLANLIVDVACPAGGSGLTIIPWPVAKKFQGRNLSLDVAADVFYPEGRGAMIRFRGGLQLGPAGFDTWRAVLTVAGAMAGILVMSRTARVKIKLPTDVDEMIDADLPITTRILWELDSRNDQKPSNKGPVSDPDF